MYHFFNYNHLEWIDFFVYPIFLLAAYGFGYRYDEMKYHSEKDTLTNLYNRRFLITFFQKSSHQQLRSGRKNYVLVIDCDHFKSINDTYGHAVGDSVLSGVSHILKERTRSTDTAARWGGDEFVLIGQYEGNDALEGLISRIKEEINLLSKDMKIPISVSIGSAIFPDDHCHLDELVSIADKKMYVEKQKRSIA
jgi:diguanylate cyclase (GGDEF)-like protein